MRKINLILNGDQSHSCMYFEIWVDFLRADKMSQVDFKVESFFSCVLEPFWEEEIFWKEIGRRS